MGKISLAERSYFDHAASSPLRPAAGVAISAAMQIGANPSATHASGRHAKAALEDARESIAASLGAHPSEVVFTSGGSEADSIAVLGSMRVRDGKALVSAVEHPAVLGALDYGAVAWPVGRDGHVRSETMPTGPFAVVSVMGVNNETGICHDLSRVVSAAHRLGAWAHSDLVQWVGHLPFDFADSGLDLASVSAHKIGGPVGIGALLIKRDIRPASLGLGGGQERSLRSGTQPVMLAVGFAAAVTEAVAELEAALARYSRWRSEILRVALALPDSSSASLEAKASPHIVSLTFAGLRADDLLFLLDDAGLDASVGSACRAGVHQPSDVLLAMGRSVHEASSSVRFSFGHTTTDADVQRLCAVLPEAVAQARNAYITG